MFDLFKWTRKEYLPLQMLHCYRCLINRMPHLSWPVPIHGASFSYFLDAYLMQDPHVSNNVLMTVIYTATRYTQRTYFCCAIWLRVWSGMHSNEFWKEFIWSSDLSLEWNIFWCCFGECGCVRVDQRKTNMCFFKYFCGWIVKNVEINESNKIKRWVRGCMHVSIFVYRVFGN